jgi:hypothetical protein
LFERRRQSPLAEGLEEAPALNGLACRVFASAVAICPSPGRGAREGFSERHPQGPARRGHELVRIAPTLSYLALAPAIGGQQAVEAIVAEHEAMRDGANLSLAS